MSFGYSIYSGAGNTFLLVDNRENTFPKEDRELISDFCKEKKTDGLLLVESSTHADYKMVIYNSDGSLAEMCGNGLRVFVKFLKELGIAKTDFTIETGAKGIFKAELKSNGEVLVEMPPFASPRWNLTLTALNRTFLGHFLNTGVPHLVIFFDYIENLDVLELGKALRFHPFFAPQGTNVDFVSCKSSHTIEVRTYERGVEGETLACGTGATASALAASVIKGLKTPVNVITRSKEILKVSFQFEENIFKNVTMQGPAKKISEGVFCINQASSIL